MPALCLIAAAGLASLPASSSGSAYPGRNGIIVFERGGKIHYGVEGNPGAVRRVPLPAGLNGEDPQISPNGRSIVFTIGSFSSRQFTANGLVVATLVNGRLRLSSPTLAHRSRFWGTDEPTWSPDGRRIAFQCTLRLRRSPTEICSIGANGTGWRRLTHCNCISAGGPDVTWSRRNELAFEHQRAIFKIPAGGGVPRRVTNPDVGPDGGPDGYHQEPSWSPNGDHIAYEASGSGSIQVVPRAGGQSVRILPGSFSGNVYSFHEPAWSPDGRRIAVRVNAISGPFTDGIWTYGLATGDWKQVSRQVGPNDFDPDWGPFGPLSR